MVFSSWGRDLIREYSYYRYFMYDKIIRAWSLPCPSLSEAEIRNSHKGIPARGGLRPRLSPLDNFFLAFNTTI